VKVEQGLPVRLAVLCVSEPPPITQKQCPVLSDIVSFHKTSQCSDLSTFPDQSVFAMLMGDLDQVYLSENRGTPQA
jgi:hypothetical protein